MMRADNDDDVGCWKNETNFEIKLLRKSLPSIQAEGNAKVRSFLL